MEVEPKKKIHEMTDDQLEEWSDKYYNGKWRHLNEDERESLFALYKKHTGNISAITRDEACPFNDRAQVSYYRDIYEFDHKFHRITTKEAEEDRKRMRIKAMKGKHQAIEKAVEFLESEDCSSNDMKRSYEILKTELGEPTSINQNENTNKFEDDVDNVEVNIVRNKDDINETENTEEDT